MPHGLTPMGRRSGPALGQGAELMQPRGGVQAAVPRAKHEPAGSEQQGGGQVQGVEAAQAVVEGELGRLLDEILVDLDHPKGGPLLTHRLRGSGAGGQSHGANGLDEGDATGKPAIVGLHGGADKLAVGLGHVALDQRA